MPIKIEIKVWGPVGCGKSSWLEEMKANLQAKGFEVHLKPDEHRLTAKKCRKLYQREYFIDSPQEVIESTNMDLLGDFIEAKCFVAPEFSASTASLYQAYEEWSEQPGHPEKMRLKSFVSILKKGFQSKRMSGGRRVWCGLGLHATS